jgi:hypothetical protein
MIPSRLIHWFKNKVRPVRRPIRKYAHHGWFRPKLEALAERVLPAVTATFIAADGTLRVIGDDLDNTIVVSRDAGGTILVNNGAVAIQGGPATVANTSLIFMNGLGGNDNLSLNESNGALPMASISGGAGNDTIIGGSGDEFIDGGPGNDHLIGGAGNDTFQWNPGDGSDVIDGGGGKNELVFNGSDVAEKFGVSANGNRVRLTRDVGNVTMDLDGIEGIELNALGGADTITVNDTAATDLRALSLSLHIPAGADVQPNSVIINGTNGDDSIQIVPDFTGTNITVLGLSPTVTITGAEGTNDHLTVNTLGGNDVVDSSSLPAGLIGLTVNKGDGQAAPVVAGVIINDGSVQRSEVRSLTVTFSGPVSFAGGNANAAAAFTLTRVTGSGGTVGLAATVSTNGLGQTVVTLTFTGTVATDSISLQDGGQLSLADGRFQLSIRDGAVTGPNGLALDGDGNGTAGGAFVSPQDTAGGGPGQLRLFRLFGDATGDGVVDLLDLAAFRSTFNANSSSQAYLEFLDANHDGVIDLIDLGQFRGRFNQSVF